MRMFIIACLLFATGYAQTGNVQVLLTGDRMSTSNIDDVCVSIATFLGGTVVPFQCHFLRGDTSKLYVQIEVTNVVTANQKITGNWYNEGDGTLQGTPPKVTPDITAGVHFEYMHSDAYNYYVNIQQAKTCTVSNSDGTTGMNSGCQISGETTTKQGAFCDSGTSTDGGTTGRCIMCPPVGCGSAKSSFNIGNQGDCELFCNKKAALASATVNTECTVNTRAADCGVSRGTTETFCIGGDAGICASCDLIDRSGGHLACFDYPGFDIGTSIGCVAICEGDEYSAQTKIEKDGEADYIKYELSGIESVPNGCPDAGCCSGTGQFDGSLCTQGSSVATSNKDDYDDHDAERDGNNCFQSRACGDPSNFPGQDEDKCYLNYVANEEKCLVISQPFGDSITNLNVPGRCLEGNCALYPEFEGPTVECPPHKPILSVTKVNMRACGTDFKEISLTNLRKTQVPLTTTTSGIKEPTLIGDANRNVVCYSSSTTEDLMNGNTVTQKIDSLFDTLYIDPKASKDAITISYYRQNSQGAIETPTVTGRCIVSSSKVPKSYFQGSGSGGLTAQYTSEEPKCVIDAPGYYRYRQQDISLILSTTPSDCSVVADGSGKPLCTELDTLLLIPYQTKFLMQVMACPMIDANTMAVCRGTMTCQAETGMPCNGFYHTCTGVSSHGDPIIWTFGGECYDLSKDGMYSAAEHPLHDHSVEIAVHNDYMREIQVLDAEGNIWLSINNMGEVIDNSYPYAFSEVVKECPEGMYDCIDTYVEYEFDALDFSWVVEILRHDYNDNALKEGEFGYHLDIIPRPYSRHFKENLGEYTGLYFENPLPEELEYCPAGSPRT